MESGSISHDHLERHRKRLWKYFIFLHNKSPENARNLSSIPQQTKAINVNLYPTSHEMRKN
jgi:hypothetical protein